MIQYKLSDFIISVIENSYHNGQMWRLAWIGSVNQFYININGGAHGNYCPKNWTLV